MSSQDQDPQSFLTECSITISDVLKITPNNPSNGKVLVQLIIVGISFRPKWVKVAFDCHPPQNSRESDLGCTSRINLHAHPPIPWNQPLPYIEGLLFMEFDNVTLTSQKPCHHNNMFDCGETNSCNVLKKKML